MFFTEYEPNSPEYIASLPGPEYPPSNEYLAGIANEQNITAAVAWLKTVWVEQRIFGTPALPAAADISWLGDVRNNPPAEFIELAEWQSHGFFKQNGPA